MPARDPYLDQLVAVVVDLITNNNLDPSCEEIAESYIGHAPPPAIVEYVRRRLLKIRDVCEQDHGMAVCPVNADYYRLINAPPTSRQQARLRLPIGRGVRTHGLHLRVNDDLIYQAWLGQNLALGAGKVHRNGERVVDGVAARQIARPDAAELMADSHARLVPRRPRQVERIMRALPPSA